MNESHSVSNKLLLVVTIYAAFFASGVVQVVVPNFSGLNWLIGFLAAGAATWWVASDSRDRGKPILHILQLFIVLLWPIAVPGYLIATRGFRGVAISVAHAVGLTLIFFIAFLGTVFSVYGLDAYARQL